MCDMAAIYGRDVTQASIIGAEESDERRPCCDADVAQPRSNAAAWRLVTAC